MKTSRSTAASSLPGKTETPHEKENSDNQRHGLSSRRNTRSPITHAKNAVAAHHLPKEQRRLFQPGSTVQRGNHPVMAGQHLMGNLGIARFVRAEKTKCAQSKKEKEKAHAENQHELYSEQFVAIIREKVSIGIAEQAGYE